METTTQPNWATLLRSATEEPGTISSAYSQFHDYSIGNQLLAMWQCRIRGIAPGPIATYPAWIAKGRQVRKGEKAIELCMPITGKKTKTTRNEETGEDEEIIASYSIFVYRKNWFVLSQTDGNEYQPPPVPTWDKELALANLAITLVPFRAMDGNSQGYASQREIAVSPLASDPNKTFLHEVAHVVLGHTDKTLFENEAQPRNEIEMEAEAVTMLLSETLSIGNAEHSRGYIQSWYGLGKTIPEKNARRIFAAADRILKAGKEKNDGNHE